MAETWKEFFKGFVATAAALTSANPTLTSGEIGFESDTGKYKFGDGSTAWNSLGYSGARVSGLAELIFASALPENTAIILDAALSADGKYSGIVETGTAGTTLAFGDVVYQAVADGRWELAKADAESTAKHRLGICVQAAASDGSATTILLYGKVRADTAFPTFTKYAPVFISAATAGDLTSTAPTGTTGYIVRCVGHAISGDELHFSPDGIWLELS